MNPNPGNGPPLVLITGASSGIGQALAARYATAGWRLALVARRSAEMQAWARSQGLGTDRAGVYGADVAQPASIFDAAQACIARQGLPDVVVANAGISVGIDTAEREDIAVMQDSFALNNTGLAATFQPFLTPMRERRRGTLVGIASVAAIRGLPGHGAYCASKAAVVAYCESLRVECRGTGVRVVTLLPGYVSTPLTAGNPYSMPFQLPASVFAERAFRAIEAGVSYRVIPWQMAIVAKLLRLMPNALYDRAMAGRKRKPRRGGVAGS
jgi:short-subunit dehydrogenase